MADDTAISPRAKTAGAQIRTEVLDGLRTDRGGVHAESLLTALGAIAGFACQMGLRAEAAAKGVAAPLAMVRTRDDRTLYVGDALDQAVAGSPLSLWSLCARSAQRLGAEVLDVDEIFAHAARAAGTPDFDVPRVPRWAKAEDLPINYVRACWPSTRAILEDLRLEPPEWRIAAGLAAQEALLSTKDRVPLEVGLRIVMESAIPMARIDPREVRVAIPERPTQK